MTLDYSDDVQAAYDEIAFAGREVTLRVVTSSNNPQTGVVTTTNSDTTVNALQESYHASQIDGTTIKHGDIKYLIPAKGISAPTTDDQIIDNGVTWNIQHVEPLQPGPTPILYTVQVRR